MTVTMNIWVWGVAVILGTTVARFITNWMTKRINRLKYRITTKYYLRSLRIRFPDAEDINLIAVETSDEAAMDKIKEGLRDEHRKRVRRRT